MQRTTLVAEPPRALPGLDAFAREDALAGRAYLSGTAVVPAQGSVSFSVRQPVLPLGTVSLGASLHDRLEIGVVGYWEHDGETEGFLSLFGKLQVLRFHNAAVALQGGLLNVGQTGVKGVSLLGVVGSTCLDGASCRFLATLHVNALLPVTPCDSCGDAEAQGSIMAGGSLIGGHRYKLVAEANQLSVGEDRGIMLYAGVRLPSSRFSVDLGASLFAAGGYAVPLPVLGFGGRI